MKIGDLVKCVWQPTTSRVVNDRAVPMKHTIKGELGIIVQERRPHYHRVLFPQFGYEHDLSSRALEVIE